MTPSHGRVLGLDVGEKRIGMAISDPLMLTAQPVGTYVRVSKRKDFDYFGALIAEREVCLVVCGLPLNMDGSEGFQAEATRRFAERLRERCGIDVEFCDERLTTAIARGALIEGGMRRAQRKEHIDCLAATQILQTWMDKTKNNG